MFAFQYIFFIKLVKMIQQIIVLYFITFTETIITCKINFVCSFVTFSIAKEVCIVLFDFSGNTIKSLQTKQLSVEIF